MNGKCIDIGTIQAFLDGETAPALSLAVTSHVANCQNCAVVLADAEEESSVVFSALDREFNSLVPTQRLWSKINESIEVEKSRTPLWERFWRSLSVFTANPSISVAASVLIVFTMFAAIWTMNSDVMTDDMIAGNGQTNTLAQQQPIVNIPDINSERNPQMDPGPLKVDDRTRRFRTVPLNASFKESNNRPRVQLDVSPQTALAPEYLPGEESYVKTIAGLKHNVDGDKDNVLPPSVRIAYERDMAVVDDAITRMKAVVRINPTNHGAKQVLYSSYQDKIDLLNTVAQREELMASIDR